MSFEQKIKGQQRLMVALVIAAFIVGMVTMYIISMPPVWIEEVCI